MALPQQGTETCLARKNLFSLNDDCVNGLTPTGDGNLKILLIKSVFGAVLMALPQQGTETSSSCSREVSFRECVNGLTPTGDGNLTDNQVLERHSKAVLMALPQQGTETVLDRKSTRLNSSHP